MYDMDKSQFYDFDVELGVLEEEWGVNNRRARERFTRVKACIDMGDGKDES